MRRVPSRALYTRWLLIAIVLHNCEEVFALARMPEMLGHVHDLFGLTVTMPSMNTVRAGLAAFALVPALILWRAWSDAKAVEQDAAPSPRLVFVTCMIAAMTATNAVAPHLILGVMLGGYVPGLITAIALTLPVGVLTLGAAWRDSWLAPRTMLAATALGIVLLPLVLTGFWAAAELVDAARTGNVAGFAVSHPVEAFARGHPRFGIN